MTTIHHHRPVRITSERRVRIFGHWITYWRRTKLVRSTYIAPEGW